MKLRSTTPVSLTRLVLPFMAALMLFGSLTTMFVQYNANPVAADQYDDRIRALQADMARYQAEVDKLNDQQASLQNTLAQLANEKRALQAQIDLNQAEYEKLTDEIAQTEAKIKENQDVLGATLADLYVDDDISPIEMLASSKSISDFIDKQEYRNSVRDELNTTIAEVKELKQQLTDKKAEVEAVLAEQKDARDQLVSRESQQASLLAQANSDESEYEDLIAESKDEIAAAKAAQAALRARTESTGGYQLVDSGSLSAYPWNNSNCPMWGMLSTGGANGNGGDGYGYGCRQCVSYAAWRIAKETGIYYSDLGNGGQVGHSLVAKGYKNLGRTPQPGSVAMLWAAGSDPYGHVAWVEAVSGDQVLVSQYNYNYGAGWGLYSEMWLSANFFDQYVKVN